MGRTYEAARDLSEMFAKRRVHKEYLAIVAGIPSKNAGVRMCVNMQSCMDICTQLTFGIDTITHRLLCDQKCFLVRVCVRVCHMRVDDGVVRGHQQTRWVIRISHGGTHHARASR